MTVHLQLGRWAGDALTPIITRPKKLFQLDATYGLGRVNDDVRH